MSLRDRRSLDSDSSFLQKFLFVMNKFVTSPRSSISWVFRGHLAKDRVLVAQTYWFSGALPRVPLTQILPGVGEAEVLLPRTFDRKYRTSITVEEACNLGAIAKHRRASKVLEIGTFDGNSALLFAANLAPDGIVVTIDLPPEFDLGKQSSLTHPEVELNLTPRDQLGRQIKGHPLSARIRQVFGDSASLDWESLGGPFDLVFVDGCHSEAYVQSDSQNAIRHLIPGGAIVWHDYGMISAVSNVVDRLARETTTMTVFAIEGTRLAIGLT